MTVNPLPPQAYTKETLQKAYAWLLHQSPSVKDMATTQDMLISLYLKAQRSGDASLETPSIQNFKQELKNLASMIGDLQPAAPAQLQTRALPVTGLPLTMKESSKKADETGEAAGNAGSPPAGLSLDTQSQLAISEVREALNLSNDAEALRALISLGYRQFKKI